MKAAWHVPSQRAVAVACVGEDDHTDALLRAALATRRSQPPIEERCRVRITPGPDAIRVFSQQGDQLASLSRDDEADLRERIERHTAEQGELWCDARITGRAGLAAQWRMQLWVYFAV